MTSVRSPPTPTTPVSATRSAARRALAPAPHAAPPPSAGRRRASRARATWWTRPSSPYSRDVPAPLQGLTERQREVVTHAGGPLLVLGVAGLRQDARARRRHAWLAAEGGLAPEHVLALTHSAPPSTSCARSVEEQLARGFAELHVHTIHGFCARLLRDEADEAGHRPVRGDADARRPARDAARARRRADAAAARLPRQPGRDAGRRPRADRPAQGGARHAPTRSRPGRPRCPAGDDARRARARVRAGLPRPRPDAARAGRARPRRPRAAALALLPSARTCARASRRAAATCSSTTSRTSPTRTCGSCWRCRREHRGLTAAGDPDQAIRARAARRPKNLRDIAAELPGHDDAAPRALAPLARSWCSTPRAPSSPPTRTGSRGAGRGPRRAGSVALLALRQRARAGAGRRGRDRAAAARRARARATSRCSCARCARRARRSAPRSTSAPFPTGCAARAALFERAEVKDVLAWLRLLVDPGDAGAVVRALARPPVELRAIDLARCVQIARRRKLDMVARARRRDRVAADRRPRRASGSSAS